MKVLHLPSAVGGNAWGLSLAERQLGLHSRVLNRSNDWFGYGCDFSLNLENKSKFFQSFKLFQTFLKVRNEYDVYHFNFGSSLIDYMSKGIHLLDIPYYKGKKVMTFNGCDARQKYPTIKRVKIAACHQKGCYNGMCNSGKLDNYRQKRIKKAAKHVDHFFALNPDLMYFLPSEKSSFLPYAIDGLNAIKPEKKNKTKKLRIIHSPTNREAKGSKFILNALKKLEEQFKNIEVQIVENVPNSKALQIYQQADIVIDQVLIGWYGGFGVEVMKMGKPLAVFIREEDLKFIPQQMAKDLKEAIININPFNIDSVLSEYVENPSLLKIKSEASLEFVNRWHNPIEVAKITKSVYES